MMMMINTFNAFTARVIGRDKNITFSFVMNEKLNLFCLRRYILLYSYRRAVHNPRRSLQHAPPYSINNCERPDLQA